MCVKLDQLLQKILMITLKCFYAHIMLIFRQWRSPHLLLDVHKAEEEGTDGKRVLEGAEFCIHGP